MKHLDVLADAGLITRTKSGRTVTVRLRFQPMREAMAWLSRYERFWTGSLDGSRPTPNARKPKREARADDQPYARTADQGATVDRVRRRHDRGRHLRNGGARMPDRC